MRSLLFVFTVFILICGASCHLAEEQEDPMEASLSKDELEVDFAVFNRLITSAHPSLNLYLSEKESAFLLDSIWQSLRAGMTVRNFYNALFFFTNKIGCSHTTLDLPDRVIDTLYHRKLFFPFPVLLVDSQLVINGDFSLGHGTTILSINSIPSTAILKDIAGYNPIDGNHPATQEYLSCADFGLQYYLKYGGKKEFVIEIKDTLGKQSKKTISSASLDKLRDREANLYYYDQVDVPYSLHINEEENYALLRLTSFKPGSENAEAAFEDFLENSFELLRHKSACKNLIIDLRQNTGGYLYYCFALFSYLTNSPFREYDSVFCRIRKIPEEEYLSSEMSPDEIDDINKELKDDFVWKSSFQSFYTDSLILTWSPKKNRFRGNIYVVTSQTVMSSASYFSTLVKNSGAGKIVGVETAGSGFGANGFATLEYELPHSGIKLRFPFAFLDYSLGSTKSERGIIPDYYVPDNRGSFMRNRDTQLFYIVNNIINKSK